MAQCECLEGCPFFHDKMENMPAMAEIYKTKYCLGSSDTCARHVVFSTLGKPKVPSDLYPNDMAYAKRIIAESQALS